MGGTDRPGSSLDRSNNLPSSNASPNPSQKILASIKSTLSLQPNDDTITVRDASAIDGANPSHSITRHMSLFSGISFVLGMIIGSGIFASPGPVLQYTGGNIGLSLFVWIFSGILAILGGLCYAELGTRMPKSGGEHPYMMAAYAGVEGDEIHGYKTSTAVGDDDSFHEVAIEKRVRGWGSLPSFLFTWTGAVATRPGSVAIIAVTFAKYVIGMLRSNDMNQHTEDDLIVKFVAVGSVGLLTLFNILSVRMGTRISDVSTVLKMIALTVIAVVGIVALSSGMKLGEATDSTQIFDYSASASASVTNTSLTTTPVYQFANTDGADNTHTHGNSQLPTSLLQTNFVLASYNALWAYDGWNNLNLVTGELVNPSVNLPIAVTLGPFLVIVCYLLANIAYLTILPPDIVQTSNAVAVDFGQKLFGSAGMILFSVAVLISTFGALNSTIYGGSRVYFVSSHSGHLPKFIGGLSSRFQTPIYAILVQSSISIILIFVGDYETLVNFWSTIAWVFYGFSVCSIFIMRYRDRHWDKESWSWMAFVKGRRPLVVSESNTGEEGVSGKKQMDFGCGDPRTTFRIPLIIPTIFIMITVLMLVFGTIQGPYEALGGWSLLVSGIPVWYVFVHKGWTGEMMLAELKLIMGMK